MTFTEFTIACVEAGIEKSKKVHEKKIGRGYLAIPFAKLSAPQTFVLKCMNQVGHGWPCSHLLVLHAV